MKHHTAAATHKHSKVVGMKDGYRPMNRTLGSKSQKVSRPDVAYSTGHGRHNVGNDTMKNAA